MAMAVQRMWKGRIAFQRLCALNLESREDNLH